MYVCNYNVFKKHNSDGISKPKVIAPKIGTNFISLTNKNTKNQPTDSPHHVQAVILYSGQ